MSLVNKKKLKHPNRSLISCLLLYIIAGDLLTDMIGGLQNLLKDTPSLQAPTTPEVSPPPEISPSPETSPSPEASPPPGISVSPPQSLPPLQEEEKDEVKPKVPSGEDYHHKRCLRKWSFILYALMYFIDLLSKKPTEKGPKVCVSSTQSLRRAVMWWFLLLSDFSEGLHSWEWEGGGGAGKGHSISLQCHLQGGRVCRHQTQKQLLHLRSIRSSKNRLVVHKVIEVVESFLLSERPLEDHEVIRDVMALWPSKNQPILKLKPYLVKNDLWIPKQSPVGFSQSIQRMRWLIAVNHTIADGQTGSSFHQEQNHPWREF